jgi:uncharacterized protein
MRPWRLCSGVLLGAALVMMLIAACASYTTRLRDLRGVVTRGEIDAALGMIAKVSDPGDLLYHLERGALYHYARDWSQSNAELATAEQLLDDLYTISVSRRALTMLLHDEAEAYRGQIHEGHFLHYYRLLNFHYQGMTTETAVEARRLALRLSSLRDDLSSDPLLRDMPFLQWVVGAVLEGQGEANDALIAYRWAKRGYADWASSLGLGAPDWLERSLLRAAARSGIAPDELPETRETAGADRLAALEAARGPEGELILLCELGWAPQRQSKHIRVPIFTHEANWSGADEALSLGFVLAGRYDYYLAHNAWSADDVKVAYFLDVAIPILPDREPLAVAVCEVAIESLAGGAVDRVTLVPLADVDALVRHVYRKGLPGTLAKTFARALLKFVAKKQAEKELGTIAGILTNIAGAAIEKADTRSWLLLPSQVRGAALQMPAGRYRLTLATYSHQGGRLGSYTREVEIGERGTRVISWRVLDS